MNGLYRVAYFLIWLFEPKDTRNTGDIEDATLTAPEGVRL